MINMKRIAGLAAAFVLAFTAPASAHFYSVGPVGSGGDCNVTYEEAKYITAAYIGGYHGGVHHFGATLAIGGCSRKIGVRANDNALLYANVRVVSGGRYVLEMNHQ